MFTSRLCRLSILDVVVPFMSPVSLLMSMMVLVEVRAFIHHSSSSLYVYIEALPPQSQSLGYCCALYVPRALLI
jgi:hypothetical protein